MNARDRDIHGGPNSRGAVLAALRPRLHQPRALPCARPTPVAAGANAFVQRLLRTVHNTLMTNLRAFQSRCPVLPQERDSRAGTLLAVTPSREPALTELDYTSGDDMRGGDVGTFHNPSGGVLAAGDHTTAHYVGAETRASTPAQRHSS